MNYIEQEKEEIIEELFKTNKVKPGQLINYEYFIKLYDLYKDKMKEVEFASILGISYANFNNLKYKGQKASILKDRVKKLSQKDKNIILKEIVNRNKIKPDQSIDYEYFLELYEPYKDEIKEVEFASILGINCANFNNLKYKGQKVRILKNTEKKISEKEREEIIKKILKDNKVKPAQSIDYEYFLELYEPYKDKIKEVEFASLLDISYSMYNNLKNRGENARVLKNRERETTQEEKEEIIENLLKTNRIKPGQLINYEYFLELYEPYKDEMKEMEFASIIGITYENYGNIKNIGTRTKVDDFRKKSKLEKIKYLLEKEVRYYSKEEIENLSRRYEISIETLIRYIFYQGKKIDVSHYVKRLEEKGEVWIGKVKCRKAFANKHAKTIIREAERISNILCLKYNCEYIMEDIAGDAIKYVLQKCGDIERNFDDEEDIAKASITSSISVFIRYKCLSNTKARREESFYSKIIYKNNEEKNVFDRGIEDKSQNVSKQVEQREKKKRKQNTNLEDVCIELLNENLKLGLNREDAIARTCKTLGLDPQKMMVTLKEYMINKNKVRQTQDGGFVLGE